MFVIIPVIIIVGLLIWMLRPRKKATSDRKIAIIGTTIPPFLLAVAAIVFQVIYNAAEKTWVSDISNTLVIAGFGLICAAILIAVGLAIVRKGDIAKGIGFGICIAIIIFVIEFGLLEWLGGV